MTGLNPFRDLTVSASESQYAFSSPSNPHAPALVVSRPSGDLRLADSPAQPGGHTASIAGILGTIKLRLDKYVIIITKAQLVGRIHGHMVYRIQATEFLPLREEQMRDPDEDAYLALLRTHLRTGPMYFSYTTDLTSSFQRQSTADVSLPLWQRADDRFFWNRHVQTDLIGLRSTNSAADPYILPVFFGFLSISTTVLKTTPVTFILLTRRSRRRAGTRYFTRGLDGGGNAANFNETEQIVILNDATGGLGDLGYDKHSLASAAAPQTQTQTLRSEGVQIFSYVQTRGSVPAFWSELNNLRPIPALQVRSADAALAAARAHFAEQIALYGDNYLVNLVNQGGREAGVKAAYEDILKSLVSAPADAVSASERTSERFHIVEPGARSTQMDRLHYVYFDFHHECRSMQWHRAARVVDTLEPALAAQRYFHSAGAGATSTTQNLQTSVVRTNCMDCLDRTNVVQSILARHALTAQLRAAHLLAATETAAAASPTLDAVFRGAWADNADAVSRAYSGTGALKTDFTRTGIRTTAGVLADASTSATRWLRSNFADGPRQDAFDLFLGEHHPAPASAVFADRRPLLVQAVPYVLAAAVFLELMALAAPRAERSSAVPIRLFVVVWLAVGVWAVSFLVRCGELFVAWPKLRPPAFAVEGYGRALAKAKADEVIGKWVGGEGHEWGFGGKGSLFATGRLEEGKERVE